MGASGSGKTAWSLQQVPRSAPLLVWDSTGAWWRTLGLRKVRSIQELAQLVIQDMRGEHPGLLRVSYVGPIDEKHFESFCALAWVWLRSSKQNWLVVEELSDVTSPGKAPRSWGAICRKNRYEGGWCVIAITQRPQESDKTILGNCALIHCGRMNTHRDRKYMTEILDVDPSEVEALQDLDYLHRDCRTHQVSRGRVHNPSVK